MPIHEGEPGPALVDRAADAALEAITRLVESEGREVGKVFILLNLVPDSSGEVDATSAGQGFEDGKDLFVELVGHMHAVGKQLGLTIVVAPMGRG